MLAKWQLAVVVMVVLLMAGLMGACDKAPVLAKGDPAPPFALEDLRGATRPFPERFAGQPVVIRFWADWCPACRSDMKVLDQHYRQRQEQGLKVLAVNVGQDRATAQRFTDEYQLTFDVLLDRSSEIARRYGVNALPMTYLIAPDGKIINKIIGETDTATLTNQLNRLMGGNR
ncbi:MAG: redoxin domain-containing protein [Magnetococcales bacterium]|nr:redoxin domain-containing protein [Magnetococcales bacterium]